MFSLENLTMFLIENLMVAIWAVAIIVFSILAVLVPVFVWRISANIAAIRELIEAYLIEVSRKSENSEYHYKA